MIKQSFIIGITGGSGSGKTSILREIKNNFDEKDICIVSQDDYYKPREDQAEDENGIKNFDLPQSILLDELYEDLLTLCRGEQIRREEYVFNNSEQVPEIKVINPAPVIIVEGLFVNMHAKLYNHFDLKVFVEAKDHLKIIRRIKRDRIERNYPLDDVLYRYQHHVQPAYEQYILPFMHTADIVINNNSHYSPGLAVLKGFLKDYIRNLKKEVVTD